MHLSLQRTGLLRLFDESASGQMIRLATSCPWRMKSCRARWLVWLPCPRQGMAGWADVNPEADAMRQGPEEITGADSSPAVAGRLDAMVAKPFFYFKKSA